MKAVLLMLLWASPLVWGWCVVGTLCLLYSWVVHGDHAHGPY